MLTLFSWGYWGWGNATRELVQAIDASERRRGFKPPVFFDIRYRRNVRAKGFRSDAFERRLPKGRYRWFPRLGNRNVSTHKRIKIAYPFSAKLLLEEALIHRRQNRRIIFFCACEFPRFCHRRVVAKLILKEAQRLGRRVEVVEWPGRVPLRKRLRLNRTVYDAVSRGLVHVPLPGDRIPRDLVDLPWGSIMNVLARKQNFPIISGPALFRDGWLLPIWERCDAKTKSDRLRALSDNFRKRNGLRTPRDSENRAKDNSSPEGTYDSAALGSFDYSPR